MATDKPQYAPGDTVTIFGKVSDSQGNPVVGAAVSIEVNEPPIYVQLVSSDQSGSYSNQFALSGAFPQGQYTIFVTAHKGNITAAQQAQFTVVPQQTTSSITSSSTSSSSQTTPPSQCFIATATYGSPSAPEVSLLRRFRDTKILQTSAGRSFMLAFNTFYYSFSPRVATYVASNAALKTSLQVLLFPLIGTLFASDWLFSVLAFNPEGAVTVAGIFAATVIGFIYLGPILLTITKFRKLSARTFRILAGFGGGALLGLALGETLGNLIVLTSAAVGVVLSFILLGGASTLYVAQLLKHGRR